MKMTGFEAMALLTTLAEQDQFPNWKGYLNVPAGCMH